MCSAKIAFKEDITICVNTLLKNFKSPFMLSNNTTHYYQSNFCKEDRFLMSVGNDHAEIKKLISPVIFPFYSMIFMQHLVCV